MTESIFERRPRNACFITAAVLKPCFRQRRLFRAKRSLTPPRKKRGGPKDFKRLLSYAFVAEMS